MLVLMLILLAITLSKWKPRQIFTKLTKNLRQKQKTKIMVAFLLACHPLPFPWLACVLSQVTVACTQCMKCLWGASFCYVSTFSLFGIINRSSVWTSFYWHLTLAAGLLPNSHHSCICHHYWYVWVCSCCQSLSKGLQASIIGVQ